VFGVRRGALKNVYINIYVSRCMCVLQASKCYRNVNPTEAAQALRKAVALYVENGKFSMAARHQKDLAEVSIFAFVHTYTDVYTYIRTYIHTYIHAYINTCVYCLSSMCKYAQMFEQDRRLDEALENYRWEREHSTRSS
jgi:hypothetical protein